MLDHVECVSCCVNDKGPRGWLCVLNFWAASSAFPVVLDSYTCSMIV